MVVVSSIVYMLLLFQTIFVSIYLLTDAIIDVNSVKKGEMSAIDIDKIDRSMNHYDEAVQALLGGMTPDNLIIDHLSLSLSYNPLNVPANQLIGALLLRSGNPVEAVKYMEIVLDENNGENVGDVSNLIEAYRRSNQFDKALKLGDRYYSRFMNYVEFLKNYGLLLSELNLHTQVVEVYKHFLSIDSSDKKVWEVLIQTYNDYLDFTEAERLAILAMKQFPNDYSVLFQYGAVLHMQQRVDEALGVYSKVYEANSSFQPVISNIGAIYQSLGFVEDSLKWYTLAHSMNPYDAGILNNLGSLYGIMNHKDKELEFLLKAYALEPTMEPCLVNLAGYYQDEGENNLSRVYLSQASMYSRYKTGLALRAMTMLSPITTSWEHMLQERLEMERNLLTALNLIETESLAVRAKIKEELTSGSDRIHFYLVYHGYNDRYMQELIVSAYKAIYYDLERITVDTLPEPDIHKQKQINSKRVRIAFMSKFFGIFEPHGLLLDGVMKYLPRDVFTVIVLPVTRTDGKPISPDVASAVDELYDVSLLHKHAIEQITKLQIDILVYADILSEPMNHFLSFSRLAKIQIAFWGNPITSGSQHIDYFISGDILEHPYRTHIDSRDEPYVEQVVLLSGQAIWYNKPLSPQEDLMRVNLSIDNRKFSASREEFDLENDWFVIMCPQSTFKIHPLFDQVIAEILHRSQNDTHIVVTGGRRPAWTEVYTNRIRKAISAYNDESLLKRFHVLGRVSSERFISIVKLADFVLHPFPFDGSRTSADALIAGVPFVTLPTEYLRGRMGAAFYRTMNIPELVAKNRSHYIDIVIGFSKNSTKLDLVKDKIRERLHLIWEDMTVPFEWAEFLSIVAADLYPDLRIPSLTWESFIIQSGRNLTHENDLRTVRHENQRLFVSEWGDEKYLLSLKTGRAILESFPDASTNEISKPRIFTDWKSDIWKGYSSSAERFELMPIWWQQAQQALNITKILNETSALSMFERIINDTRASLDISALQHSHVEAPSESTTLSTPNLTLNSDIVQLFREAIRNGSMDKSYAIAEAHLLNPTWLVIENYKSQSGTHQVNVLSDDIIQSYIVLVEIGLVQFYRGGYSDALRICKHAVQSVEVGSLTGLMCIGIAGTHLGIEDITLKSLLEARELFKSIRTNSFQGTHIESSLFLISESSLQYNVISALKTFGRYEECTNTAIQIAEWDKLGVLTSPTNISVFALNVEVVSMLVFSFVNWSDMSREGVKLFPLKLTKFGAFLNAIDRLDFFDIIKKTQSNIFHVLDSSIHCALESLRVKESGLEAINFIYQELISTIHQSSGRDPLIPSDETKMSSPDTGAVLISQLYISPNPITQSDMNEALYQNLNLNAISNIVLLNEKDYTIHNIPNQSKLSQHNIGKRLTFGDAFEFANQYYPDRTIIVANADIYFDESLFRILDEPGYVESKKNALALLKWKNNGLSKSLQLRTDSQDAWILRTPISNELIELSKELVLGTVRCDNRLVKLLEITGYNVINPVFAIHATEMESQERVSGLYNLKGAATGEGKSLYLSDLMWFNSSLVR